MIPIIKIFFFVLTILTTIVTSFASELQSNQENVQLTKITILDNSKNSSHFSTNNNSNTSDTFEGKEEKESFVYNMDMIGKNIVEFNSIIYNGKDLLQTYPSDQAATTTNYIKYYLIITIASIATGIAAAIPVAGTAKIISFKEESFVMLQQTLIKEINKFDVSYIEKIGNEIIIPIFNNPDNYNIKKEFIYLFTGVSILFSTMNYKVLHFITNILYLKQYRNFINSHSLVSNLSKLGITLSIFILSTYSLYNNINETLQTINNMAKGYSLDHEDKTIEIIGGICCGISNFIINYLACFPVVNLFVDTIAEGINTFARKKISFNDKPMHAYLHKLLDAEEPTDLSQKFTLNFLYNEQDDIKLQKTLQLMQLNPSQTINLAGVVNNITKQCVKNTKYSLYDKNYNKQFIFGLIKLAIISGTTFVLVKVGNNLYNDMIVAELLVSSDTVLYLDWLNNVDQVAEYVHYLDKNTLSNYITNKLKTKVEEAIESNSNSLGLVTQLALYSTSGVLYMLLDAFEAVYIIKKHRGKYYRSPIVLASSVASLIITMMFSVTLYNYIDTDISNLEKTEYVQQLVGIDTSVLGINNVSTKINIIKAFLTFGVLQVYKSFIPFTTLAILKVKKLFDNFKIGSENCNT